MPAETEVIFMMDASLRVTQEVLNNEKAFVKSLAYNFNISPRGPRGSAVIYGQRPYTIASFTEPDFNGKVDTASLLRLPRRMDLALEHAARMLSTTENVGRKIVVLLAAGRQAPGGKDLGEAIKPLLNLGTQTFIVAIGEDPSRQELLPIVHRPQDIFQVPSSSSLLVRVESIARQIREKPGEYIAS